TANPASSARDTRLEIVMVKRSLAAAKAMSAGNSRSWIASVMIRKGPASPEGRQEPVQRRPPLAAEAVQSGDDGPRQRAGDQGVFRDRRAGCAPQEIHAAVHRGGLMGGGLMEDSAGRDMVKMRVAEGHRRPPVESWST